MSHATTNDKDHKMPPNKVPRPDQGGPQVGHAKPGDAPRSPDLHDDKHRPAEKRDHKK